MVLTTAVLVALLAGVPAQKDLTGDWNVTLTAAGAAMPALTCKLTQKGQQLTGTCKAAANDQAGSVDIAGKVQGNKINCQWKVPAPDGGSWAFALTGTSDGKRTQIKGSFKISLEKAGSSGGGSQGTFVATRQ